MSRIEDPRREGNLLMTPVEPGDLARRRPWLGMTYGLMATGLFVSVYIMARFLFGRYTVDAVVFSALRFAAGALFCLAVVVARRQSAALALALKAQFGMFCLLALTGIVGEGVLLTLSLKFTTASRSCLFANASPILTVLLARWIVHEPMGRRKVAGMLIGFAGVVLATASRGGDAYMARTAWSGDAMALLSAGCWALYTVLGRAACERHGGLVTGTGALLIGSVMLLGISAFFPYYREPMHDPVFWLFVTVTGAGACGLGYILWMAALKHVDAGRLGALGYVSTLMTMGTSFWLLHERMDSLFIVSTVLVLVGVWWMLKEERKL
jgi:drug/metabolite transporter (DMT)-like permease